MAMKSDFAQKLLHDLKLRKERLSREATGHPGQTHKDYGKIKAPDSIGSTKGNSIRKSQNQIVPYGRGRSLEQKGDTSMALTFAVGNGGNRTKMDISGNNVVINFLQNIGRRSQKKTGSLEIYNPRNRSSSSSSNIPTLHITEISKGVQKLNQIITACSNGFTVDGYSIEVGKELLRGAMDLEESLRMLVDLQAASDYAVSARKKNKIKLLKEEEDEDEEEDNERHKKQVDRPRFSFDDRSKNSGSSTNYIKQHLMSLTYPDEKKTCTSSNLVNHKRSASCSNVSQAKPEKGRISNVIAKLMGLEEFQLKEDHKPVQNDLTLKKKEMTISRDTENSPRTSPRPRPRPPQTMTQPQNTPSNRDLIALKYPHHEQNRVPVYSKSSLGQDKGVNKETIKNSVSKKEVHHKVPECKKKSACVEKKSMSRVYANKQPKHQGNREFERKEEKTSCVGKKDQHLARTGEHKRSTREPLNKNFSSSSRKNQPGAVQDTARKKTYFKDLSKQKAFVKDTQAHTRETYNKLEEVSKNTNEALKPKSLPVLQEIEQPSQISNNQFKDPEAETGGNEFDKVEEQDEPHNGISILCSPDKNTSQSLEIPETLLSSDNDPVIEVCEDREVSLSQAEELLTEPEQHLKNTLIKSRLILNTAELLFKLNIPASDPQPGDHNDQDLETKLTIDSAYEIIRRKGRKQELKAHPFSRMSICLVNVKSLDDLVKQLCKDFDTLKFYGGYGGTGCYEHDPTDYLEEMLEKDFRNSFSDVNSTWDYGWNEMTIAFLEKHEIIKDIEKQVLNGLLDEITWDLL